MQTFKKKEEEGFALEKLQRLSAEAQKMQIILNKYCKDCTNEAFGPIFFSICEISCYDIPYYYP